VSSKVSPQCGISLRWALTSAFAGSGQATGSARVRVVPNQSQLRRGRGRARRLWPSTPPRRSI